MIFVGLMQCNISTLMNFIFSCLSIFSTLLRVAPSGFSVWPWITLKKCRLLANSKYHLSSADHHNFFPFGFSVLWFLSFRLPPRTGRKSRRPISCSFGHLWCLWHRHGRQGQKGFPRHSTTRGVCCLFRCAGVFQGITVQGRLEFDWCAIYSCWCIYVGPAGLQHSDEALRIICSPW